MNRRAFVTGLGAVLAAPLGAGAQQAGKVFRVGYLSSLSGSDPQIQRGLDIFRQALGELGYVEDQNLAIEYRWAEGKYERLPGLAAELVRSKVDVIVTTGGLPTAQAAQRATRTIPIVGSGTADPVAAGLVASLPRPGGNITGPTIISEELTGKQLQLLKELVPKVFRVAVLWNPTNPGNALQLRAAEAAAGGLRIQTVGVRDPGEIERAFVAMTQQRADGLLVTLDAISLNERERIAGLAARHRLPAVYGYGLYAEAGGLMAYAASRVDLIRHIAVYVDKILKGAKPADLPM